MTINPDIAESPELSPIPNFDLLRPYVGVLSHTHSSATNKKNTPDWDSRQEVVTDKFAVLSLASKLEIDAVVFEDHTSQAGPTPEKSRPVPLHLGHRISRILQTEAAAIPEYNAANTAGEFRSENEGKDLPEVMVGVESSLIFDYEGNPRTDIHPDDLKRFEMVTASIHSLPPYINSRDPKRLFELYVYAADNPDIDVVGHLVRHREFYPNDWDYFLKYYREQDPAVYAVLKEIDDNKKVDATKLKKIIGKEPLSESEINIPAETPHSVAELRQRFLELEKEYWDTLGVILDKLEQSGTAMEINLNSIRPDKVPFQRLMQMVRDRPALLLSISFDYHNPAQLGEIDKKIPQLVEVLKANGITPERVINSSMAKYKQFIEYRKRISTTLRS